MPTRAQKEAEGQSSTDQSEGSSMDAKLDQLIGMVTSLTTRVQALETSTTPPVGIPTPPAAPQDTQPSQPSQPQASSTIVPAPQSDDKRWRPEEIGEFDGTGDVYAFTDRMKNVAFNKGAKLVVTNISTLLKEKAFNWYQYELPEVTKWALNSSLILDPWCQALIERFRPSHSDLMTQLEACHYTRKDAANKKDATVYIQDVMRITKGLNWKQEDSLMTAFHHFEPGLQRDLDPPTNGGLTQFIKQVQLRQEAWHQVYSTFGQKPRPPDSVQSRQQQPQQQSYRPPPRPSYPPRPSQQQAYPPRPQQAYWAEEEEDDWVYDAPADTYHVASAYPATHGPGHTPRRYGNTHDGGGTEAHVHWTNAGEDHRCNHEGCTHYH